MELLVNDACSHTFIKVSPCSFVYGPVVLCLFHGYADFTLFLQMACNLRSACQICIICIALGGDALDSLELLINTCFMRRFYFASGFVVTCDMEGLPIGYLLHIGSMITIFLGFFSLLYRCCY